MAITKNRVWMVLGFGAVASVVVFDVWAHRQSVLAHGNDYPRSKYYTKNPRRPFTLVLRYTVTAEGMDHAIHADVTRAQDSQGRSVYTRRQFVRVSDTAPTIESFVLVENPSGNVTTLFSSKWQVSLGKPMLVAHGFDGRWIEQHTLPENNCISPEPALTFLRYEPVTIEGRDYPAAVVQAKDEVGTQTVWHSMTPGLGCLELRSIASYILPDRNRGITVQEPVSLTLLEPDSQLLDFNTRIGSTSVESVPLGRWDEEVKLKTKAYETAVAGLTRSKL